LKAGVYTNHAQQFSACPPLAESAVADIGHGVGFVDTDGAVFYHGTLAGIEVSF